MTIYKRRGQAHVCGYMVSTIATFVYRSRAAYFQTNPGTSVLLPWAAYSVYAGVQDALVTVGGTVTMRWAFFLTHAVSGDYVLFHPESR